MRFLKEGETNESVITIFIFFISSLFHTVVFAATDINYKSASEQIMNQMMGSQHEKADQNIKDAKGKDFLKQMHIAMGKMVERNISRNNSFGMMPMMGITVKGGGFNMMGGNFGMMSGGSGIYAILAWVTWILVVIALVLGIVWLWKQIQKR